MMTALSISCHRVVYNNYYIVCISYVKCINCNTCGTVCMYTCMYVVCGTCTHVSCMYTVQLYSMHTVLKLHVLLVPRTTHMSCTYNMHIYVHTNHDIHDIHDIHVVCMYVCNVAGSVFKKTHKYVVYITCIKNVIIQSTID